MAYDIVFKLLQNPSYSRWTEVFGLLLEVYWVVRFPAQTEILHYHAFDTLLFLK